MYLILYKNALNVQNTIHFYLLNAIIDIILAKTLEYADLLTVLLLFALLMTNKPSSCFYLPSY
jgi:hypothetical protein